MHTHFAAVYFDGDLSDDGHPDPELTGRGPMLTLVGVGDEESCRRALGAWIETHPLREGEHAEVLTRGPHGQYGPTADYGDEAES